MEVSTTAIFDLLTVVAGLIALMAMFYGIFLGWLFSRPGKAARHVLREALTDYLAKPEIRSLERRIASSYEAKYRDE